MALITEKIITFFKDEFPQVGLTPEMLKNPKFEIVYEAYRCLTAAIFGFNESVFAPDENYPQQPVQIVLHLMQSIINDTSTDNIFVITDLIMPKAQRFRFFLESLIDFYTFVRAHVNDIDNLFVEMDQLREKLEEDRTAIASLGDQIQKQKQKNEASKRRRLELASEIGQLQNQVAILTKEKEEIKDIVTQFEDQTKKKKESAIDLDAAIIEAAEEEKLLQRDIVENPDELLAQIQKAEEDLAKCHEGTNAFKKEARDSENQKLDAEDLKKQVCGFDAEAMSRLDAKRELYEKNVAELKETERALELCQHGLIVTQRKCDEEKAKINEDIAKLEQDLHFASEKIECGRANLLTLEQDLENLSANSEDKYKLEKRDLGYKIKQLKQTLIDMEADFGKRKDAVQSLMNRIIDFVNTEENDQKESTEVYEKALDDIQNNETLKLIKQLLEENAELTNRKEELEKRRKTQK